MRLAYSTLACPAWTLEQAADAARRYGYQGLELRLLDGELLPPDLSPQARARVRTVCAAAGLPIVCVDTSVRIAVTDPAERAAQLRDGLALMEMAAGWESPMIRVFGGPPAGTPRAQALAAAADLLAELAERGVALGVSVVLETHDAFADSPSVAKVLSKVPGDGAGVLWDSLHPYRMGESAAETMERIGAWLRHVHVKDGRRPARPSWSGTAVPAIGGNAGRPSSGGDNWELTPLGEGEVPMRSIIQALRASGYDGWLSVEWEKKWHPELAEPEVALPQHAQALREYLGA